MAHILPGQPLSWDRKNKRAAQAALREANGGGGGGTTGTTGGGEVDAISNAGSPQLQSAVIPLTDSQPNGISGIGRSLSMRDRSNGVEAEVEKEETGVEGWNIVTPPVQSEGREGILAPRSTSLSINSLLYPTSSSPRFASAGLPSMNNIHEPERNGFGPIGTPPSSGFYSSHVRPHSPVPTLPRVPLSTIHDPFARGYGNTTILSPPTGLSQPNPLQFSQQQHLASMSPRSSVAAQVMLAEQSRRYSNTVNGVVHNSTVRSASPSRVQQLQKPTRRSFGGDILGSGVMSNNGGGGGGGSSSSSSANGGGIYGTSPFQGSRSLFMPSSSYDSDDGFLGSPTLAKRGLEDVRTMARSPWAMETEARHETVIDDDDEYEEGFLPSSLNDLLTPEEQFRRSNRLVIGGGGGGGSSSFDPFQNSRSMPATEFHHPLRSRPIPSTAWTTSSSPIADTPLSQPAPQYHLRHPHSPPLLPRIPPSSSADSILQPASPAFQSQLRSRPIPAPVGGVYSSSLDPTSAFLSSNRPQQIIGQSHLTGGGGSGSLPKGLAAGLSSLHLYPAQHTGETPPLPSALGSTSSWHQPRSPLPLSNFLHYSSSSTTAAAGGGGGGSISRTGGSRSSSSDAWLSSNRNAMMMQQQQQQQEARLPWNMVVPTGEYGVTSSSSSRGGGINKGSLLGGMEMTEQQQSSSSNTLLMGEEEEPMFDMDT